MHPLLAAGLANNLSSDQVAAARARRAAAEAADARSQKPRLA